MNVIDNCETVEYTITDDCPHDLNMVHEHSQSRSRYVMEKYPHQYQLDANLITSVEYERNGFLYYDCVITYLNGARHSFNDKPAYQQTNGDTQKWYKCGVLHRDNDLPAIIEVSDIDSVMFCWYKNGVLHRDNDKPAIMIFDLSYRRFIYYDNGIIRRRLPNTPADYLFDFFSNKVIYKYYNNGNFTKQKTPDINANNAYFRYCDNNQTIISPLKKYFNWELYQ